jgi:hypothetical protein
VKLNPLTELLSNLGYLRNAADSRKMSRTGLLEPQRNLVITVGVIFKHGIDTILLNIGSGQIGAGSQQC